MRYVGIGGTAPPAATGYASALRALSFRRPPSSRRGEALWEREAAGSGSLGAASSESAADSVIARSYGRAAVRVCLWVWMVVRFFCVIRVLVCARVSRVCPGSPGVFLPACVSRLPPVSFYRYCDSCVYPVCVPARPRPVF